MAATNEFSRDVPIQPWPEGRLAVALEASAAERQALARRLDLIDLPALSAHGWLERSADGRELRFHGDLAAEVVQSCVVSLEPVPASVSVPIDRYFRLVDDPSALEAELELLLDPEEIDWEPLAGEIIDLGEVVVEELSLALDPYPRAEDPYALLPDLGPDVTIGQGSRGDSPFAVLQQSPRKAAQ